MASTEEKESDDKGEFEVGVGVAIAAVVVQVDVEADADTAEGFESMLLSVSIVVLCRVCDNRGCGCTNNAIDNEKFQDKLSSVVRIL